LWEEDDRDGFTCNGILAGIYSRPTERRRRNFEVDINLSGTASREL
jgi:hypothetical protein